MLAFRDRNLQLMRKVQFRSINIPIIYTKVTTEKGEADELSKEVRAVLYERKALAEPEQRNYQGRKSQERKPRSSSSKWNREGRN